MNATELRYRDRHPGDGRTVTVPTGPRLVRLFLAILLVLAAGVAAFFLTPTPAQAASDDQIDSFTIDYVVDESGVLNVTETIVWRFGSSSGRHGIERELITREPDADNPDKDIVYDISNFQADSPDPGVETDVDEIDNGDASDRDRSTTFRIGDPDVTVDEDTATYVLTYEVRGAMRTSGDYDELYWDATGSGNPDIQQLDITAEVPGGAQDVQCYAGAIQSTDSCDTATVSGDKATFSQANIAKEDNVTIGVKIKPGLISDNTPHLERKASVLNSFLEPKRLVPLVLMLLVSIGVPIGGGLIAKSKSTDLRYLNLPPGTVPRPGEHAEVGKDPGVEIPVAFTPPPIPISEAGILVDGQVDVRDTAATLVQLAVSGAVTLEEEQSGSGYIVRLVDSSKVNSPAQSALMQSLFAGRQPGAQVDLGSRGTLNAAHKAMVARTRSAVAKRGWFTKVPKAATTGGIGFGIVGVAAYIGWHVAQGGAGSFLSLLIFLGIPILSIIITVRLVRKRLKRGQRTADGRAVCDHVDGFKQYLATAEADQLRFEEGEDIFSRYLPWAIAFDLADRWQSICERLVQLGRIPDSTPYWYVGRHPGRFHAFNVGYLTGSLSTAATPKPSSGSGSSGSGFGSGGSSFSGGGGFSSGGGGGGGSSSW